MLSRASDRLPSISASSSENRSPARDRSRFPNTCLNSWCILATSPVLSDQSGTAAEQFNEGQIYPPHHVSHSCVCECVHTDLIINDILMINSVPPALRPLPGSGRK